MDGLGWNHMAWQHPDMPSDASENIDFYVQQAQLAEAAKFDTLFLVDVSHVGPGNIPHYLSMFEGVSIMSALSMKTKNIGLPATIASSYGDPYSAARQILSLDKISKGRASLYAITSNPGGIVNFNRGHLGKADQYPMNKEFMEILIGLWDTYEEDAFIRDKARGIPFCRSVEYSERSTRGIHSKETLRFQSRLLEKAVLGKCKRKPCCFAVLVNNLSIPYAATELRIFLSTRIITT